MINFFHIHAASPVVCLFFHLPLWMSSSVSINMKSYCNEGDTLFHCSIKSNQDLHLTWIITFPNLTTSNVTFSKIHEPNVATKLSAGITAVVTTLNADDGHIESHLTIGAALQKISLYETIVECRTKGMEGQLKETAIFGVDTPRGT